MDAPFIDPNPTGTKLLLYLGVILAFMIFAVVRFVYRQRSMKRFAAEHQFTWQGKELPDSLYLRKTSFALRDLKISNSIVGNLRGVPVAIFDAAFDLPKEGNRRARTESQTVVAFRNEGALRCSETPSTGSVRAHLEIAGDWIIAYTERKIISAAKLEAACGEIYDEAARLIQRQPALRNA